MSTLHRSAKKRVVYFAESDSEMDSEDSDEVVAAPKRKKAASNCKGGGKTDKGGRGKKKRVSIDSDSDDFELGPDADSEDSDEVVAAPKRKKAVRISIESVSDEFKLDFVDKTHDKAFVGHGEVPRASFMDDTATDLPDNDEQGNFTNADDVVLANIDRPNSDEETVMLHDLASMASSTTHSIVKADSNVADEVISMVKQMMNTGQAIYSHDDPLANARISTNGVAILDTYPPSDNMYVVENEDEVQPVKDMQKCFALRGGLKNDTGSPRLCTSIAVSGLIAAGSLENKFSPSPLLLDVIPCHSQKKFETNTSIPAKINRENIHIAKRIIKHCLESCRAVWISGADLQKTLFAVVQEMGLIVMVLSDSKINGIIKDYSQPRARYDFEEHYPVLLLHNKETKHTTVVFTCFQIGSSIAGPTTINRPSGKILIPFVHELACGFLDISGGMNRKAVFPNFTKAEDSIIHQALTTKGANKVTEILRDCGLINESMKYMYSCVVGGILSNATDPGRDKGIHYSEKLQRETMSLFERGVVGAILSNATDPGRDYGIHYSEKLQRETMSSSERAILSYATDPGRDYGVHYSEKLQRDTISSSERAILRNATDPDRDKGVHYSEKLQRETMSSSERGKQNFGVARRHKNGSIPIWIMIESVSTPTTFEPRCSNVIINLIRLLASVGAIKREQIHPTAKRWMKDWVEKAKLNTSPVKSHTFSCKGDPHKRKWKLTIYPEGEQQPSGVKEVERSILEAF